MASFSLVSPQCVEQCQAQNRSLGEAGGKNSFSADPSPGSRVYGTDKVKLGFWILLYLNFETTKDVWELHFRW